MLNQQSMQDVRRVRTGKDGALYSANGTMLATVESFQAQANVNNGKYQPLGDAQEHEVFQSYGLTLTFVQTVIEDDEFIQDMFKAMQTGEMPVWGFQGVLQGLNGSEERVIYRDCIPSGTVDIQNLSVGDVIKRSWSLFVNTPPEMQKRLTSN